jgi:hypothetical protein
MKRKRGHLIECVSTYWYMYSRRTYGFDVVFNENDDKDSNAIYQTENQSD